MRVNAMLATHDLPVESLPWMEEVREIFDELVIFIDAKRVAPGAVERAEKVASRVHRHHAENWYEWDLGSMARACESDWVFLIERDEQMSPEWHQPEWRQILESTDLTHFWISRRWTVSQDRYICDPPWWPEFQLRLFRSDQEVIFPTRLHDRIQVPGPGGAFQNLVMYHHVSWLFSHSERQRRVQLYDQMRPGESGGHYYLYENYRPAEAPIPEAKRVDPAREVIRMDKLSKEDISGISIELTAGVAEVTVSEMFWLDLEVTNATSGPLYSCPPFPIHLSYHWIDAGTRQMIAYDGQRSGVFSCAPAKAVTPWKMVVLAPDDPGQYILQMTVVQDGIEWLENINPAILKELPISVLAKE
jgi:hypothetical protein